MTIGNIYNIPAEPIKPENTRYVEAGALRFGVEYRQIDSDSLRESYAVDESLAEGLEAVMGDIQVDDRGVSIHVIGTTDGHEYFRFDCFEEGPHYHYIHNTGPGEDIANQWVPFDEAACGPMLPWTIACLRSRLPDMLRQARGEKLIAALDDNAIRRAVDEVETLARQALEKH